MAKQDAEINNSAYFLSIAFLALGLIFAMLSIATLYRLYRVFWTSSGRQFFQKLFYSITWISCVHQATFQGVFLYQVLQAVTSKNTDELSQNQFQSLFIQTIYIPDALFFITFFSLFWQYLILMHQGHISTGNILVGKNWNPERAIPFIKVFLSIYSIGQAILVFYDTMSKNIVLIMIFDIVINSSIPIIVIVVGCYLNIKFSGALFKSLEIERKNNKLQQLLQLWTVLRIPQLIVNILAIQYDDYLYTLFNGTLDMNMFWQLFLVFFVTGDVIVVQIIPIVISMGDDFFKLFLNNSEALLSSTVHEEEYEQSLQHNAREQPKRFTKDYTFGQLKYQDIEFHDDISFKRANGLGEIKVGSIKQQKFAFRIIQFNELSQFVIDETKADIRRIKGCNNILWDHVFENKLILMTKYYPNGSISKVQTGKIKLALDIARKIEMLHSQRIYHGHLNCSNILLTKNFNVKISDNGQLALKKFAGLMNGYQNKTGFTAPERLSERGNVVSQMTAEADIYSLGMVYYQLFTGKVPFQDLTVKQIQQLVLEQQTRPKITEVQTDIAQLIRCCWQQEPEKRPQIQEVIDILASIES